MYAYFIYTLNETTSNIRAMATWRLALNNYSLFFILFLNKSSAIWAKNRQLISSFSLLLSTLFFSSAISWAAASPVLSNKANYRTFLRTVGAYTAMNNAAMELIKHHNWERISIIGTQDGSVSQNHIHTIMKQQIWLTFVFITFNFSF